MDLSVSPDIPAYVCYAVVLALGALTGIVQISQRLVGIEGIWFLARTWGLFFLYLLVPLGLFWFLDRTSAIVDTSLFAAALVAVGYDRILSGRNQSLRAPGEVSQLWTPFLALADKVAKRVRDRLAVKQTRLKDKVVAEIMQDPARFKALETLVLSRVADPAAVQSQLAGINTAKGALGPTAVTEAQSNLLYSIMVTISDAHYVMRKKDVISRWLYAWEVKHGKKMLHTAVTAAIAVAIAVGGMYALRPKHDDALSAYYIWRIGKTNSTAADQLRSRQGLVQLMEDPAIGASSIRKLTALLREPGLPMDRVDLILQTLLESKAYGADNPELPALLVNSLRVGSVDARTRIHEVLKFLAASCVPAFAEPSQWKPSDGDATSVLEDRIKAWVSYWAATCPNGKCHASCEGASAPARQQREQARG
jgi:hypothetical protein